MSRRGRRRKPGVRKADGRLSEAQNARPDESRDVLHQPHRAPFTRLLGDDAARDFRCGFALGRLRMFGIAEEGAAKKRGEKPTYVIGISEAEYQAGQALAMVVGRERFARGAPKDKPAALDFLQARGLSLSTTEMSPAERQRAVADYEDARSIIAASPLPLDVRKVQSSLVQLLRQQRARSDVSDKLGRLVRIMPSLVHPVASDAVLRNVNAVVVDDRDPFHLLRGVLIVERGLKCSTDETVNDANQRAFALMQAVRRGLDSLVHFYGSDRRGVSKRPDGVGTSFMKAKATHRPDMLEPAAAPEPEADPATRNKPDRDHPYR